jgi:hypothetical protein
MIFSALLHSLEICQEKRINFHIPVQSHKQGKV